MRSTYEVGQVWTYDHRAGESESRVIVVKLDDDPDCGVVVHVAVDGVSIPDPSRQGAYFRTISHMPFSMDAIDRSVRELVGTAAALPDFSDGYNQWLAEASDGGGASFFTVSVGQAVEMMDRSVNGANR